jgi:predicted nuclease of restriction endonuclease-like (RecB) superfamily
VGATRSKGRRSNNAAPQYHHSALRSSFHRKAETYQEIASTINERDAAKQRNKKHEWTMMILSNKKFAAASALRGSLQ